MLKALTEKAGQMQDQMGISERWKAQGKKKNTWKCSGRKATIIGMKNTLERLIGRFNTGIRVSKVEGGLTEIT